MSDFRKSANKWEKRYRNYGMMGVDWFWKLPNGNQYNVYRDDTGQVSAMEFGRDTKVEIYSGDNTDEAFKAVKLYHIKKYAPPSLKYANPKLAMEHPSEKARKKYLKEHPNADPKNHSVSKSDGGGNGGEKGSGKPNTKLVKDFKKHSEDILKQVDPKNEEEEEFVDYMKDWMEDLEDYDSEKSNWVETERAHRAIQEVLKGAELLKADKSLLRPLKKIEQQFKKTLGQNKGKIKEDLQKGEADFAVKWMGLKSATIRLAYAKPELRSYLLPILKNCK